MNESLEIACPVLQGGNVKVVELPVVVRAVKYKIIHPEGKTPARNPYYERKLLGWTAPITNLRGVRLAERRKRAWDNQKGVKVRII